MHAAVVVALSEVALFLVPKVASLPEGSLPPGRSGSLLERLVSSVADGRAGTDVPIAVAERFAALSPAISSLVDAPGTARAVSAPYLASFVELALSRGDMPSDKSSRWLGFAEGVLWARGAGLPVGGGPLDPGADAPGPDELSYRLGFVQGALTVHGLLDVDEERDRTRPIFHAAYEAAGLGRPATVEVRS
jgi:hypothetical protein